MEKPTSWIGNIQRYGRKRTAEIVENLGKNKLWQRQLKNIIATTILVSICLVPRSKVIFGKAAYLGAIATVFGHPGRRFGQLVEALVLVLAGSSLGLAWSLFGLYLSSLVLRTNAPAAYSIRGVFLAVALIVHGFLRSKTPRLFVALLLLAIVSVVSLTSTATAISSVSVTQILYPILLAAGVILIVNLFLLPEFSATFLGDTTIETLHDVADALHDAGQYFTFLSGPEKQTRALAASEGQKSEVQDEEKEEQPVERPKCKDLIGSLFRLKRQGPSDNGDETKSTILRLQDLVGAKGKLRTKLSVCEAAQTECNFEIAFAVLPPRRLKPISVQTMKRLVANAIAVIGACESKFALVGEEDGEGTPTINVSQESQPCTDQHSVNDESPAAKPSFDRKESVAEDVLADEPAIESNQSELDLIKPRREIEFGDVRLFQYLLQRITPPYRRLSAVVLSAVDCVTVCIAYSYDVAILPSGARAPKGLSVEEVNIYLNELCEALISFDAEIATALEGAAELQGSNGNQLDVMPREEVFLVASFLLNLRQAASHIEEMLKHARSLVLERQSRHDRRRLYAPRIKWSKWLYTGGGEDEAMPTAGRKSNRRGEEDENADDDAEGDSSDQRESLIKKASRGKDLEAGDSTGVEVKKPAKSRPRPKTDDAMTASEQPGSEEFTLRLRGKLADMIEWVQHSDDLLYAFKLATAAMLVTWPAFVERWNQWYSLNRGLWAAVQLILVTEVSIGTSVMTFFLRGIATTLGCLWGWAALEARNGNRIVVAVMVFMGLIPSTYVQLGTAYPKAGMTVPGSSTDNFLKRWLAFFIGGVVALIVEVVFLPVKARTRLVESLEAAMRQIGEMETCVAGGIEEGINLDIYDPRALERFEHASGKANCALTAAETFRSFEGLAAIYKEILFVLHQIVDRMDNMMQLRTAYGSGPLEEYNAQLYPYRRNVAGSINLTLFAVRTSLTTKLPLPQFFPSARLAHLRMINRVREVVLTPRLSRQDSPLPPTTTSTTTSSSPPTSSSSEQKNQKDRDAGEWARHRAVRRKHMAWNATSAAQAEIIEYLEELIDLAKLLVGANEFRSGLLMRRRTERDYADATTMPATSAAPTTATTITTTNTYAAAATSTDVLREEKEEKEEGKDGFMLQQVQSPRRRRVTSLMSQGSGGVEDSGGVPRSLQRIQSRKMEAAGMKRGHP
ncbi:hypothetical protein Q9189_004667 [Teloschistes chrysophthalmus]